MNKLVLKKICLAIAFLSSSVSADIIDFSDGTVHLLNGTTGNTNKSNLYDAVDYYVEDGYKLDFIGPSGNSFSYTVGDYYGVGNDVIHGHWESGNYGDLQEIRVSKLDGSNFDLDFFRITSNTDTGGGHSSGHEKTYLNASSNGDSVTYSELLPDDDWGFAGENKNIKLGNQFENIQWFSITASNPVDCIGFDEFVVTDAGVVENSIPTPEQYIEVTGTITERTSLGISEGGAPNFRYRADKVGLDIDEGDDFSISWKVDPSGQDEFLLSVENSFDYLEPSSADLRTEPDFADVSGEDGDYSTTASYHTKSFLDTHSLEHKLDVNFSLNGVEDEGGLLDLSGFDGSGEIEITNTLTNSLIPDLAEKFTGVIGSTNYVYFAPEIDSDEITSLIEKTGDASLFTTYIEEKGKKFREVADFIESASAIKDFITCLFPGTTCVSNPAEELAWEQVGKVGDAAYVCSKEATSDKQECILRFITHSPSLLTLTGIDAEGINAISFDYLGFDLDLDDMFLVAINDIPILALSGADIMSDWDSVFLPLGQNLGFDDVLTIGLLSEDVGKQVNIRNFQAYSVNEVPEPSTILLFLMCLSFFTLRKRNRA